MQDSLNLFQWPGVLILIAGLGSIISVITAIIIKTHQMMK